MTPSHTPDTPGAVTITVTAPDPSPVPAAVPRDLLCSDAEEELRAAVRALLTDRADTAALLARAESGDPYDPAVWTVLARDIGAAGLLVPEEYGGQGASHREAAVVLEELGRAMTPAPYLTGSVIATETLLALGPDRPGVGTLLGALAAGERTAVLAVPFAASPYVPVPAGGPVPGVADALRADVLLVPREDGLYAVERADAAVTPLTALDLTRPLAVVDATGAPGTLLGDRPATDAAVRRGLLTGAGLLASEQLGVAEWCLEEAVRHTRGRHQFNRPVGSFQALKHRMAQLWLGVVSARAVARDAAAALASGGPHTGTSTDTGTGTGTGADIDTAVAVAQAHTAAVAVRTAEECVQLHAGIGMTWEHPVHLYLKRAKSTEIALGTPGAHRQALASLVGLPAPGATS
ncbi:acyl-CoA dehydrogenase family protein [Streptomyces sp. NPDC000594]|uniref:acyl-CoA dehydrogenase family protein n=1 Tax=Streptomyces sp. NPDC000594 TaxID=3154261 RepID=UPI003324EB84